MVTENELNTLLTEVESITNDRPLTYSVEDDVTAITPSHLLHGRIVSLLPHQEYTDDPDWRPSEDVIRLKTIDLRKHFNNSGQFSETST